MEKFESVASGYSFVEAPRVDDAGVVYFSDLLGGGYYRCAPGRKVETLVPGRKWIGGAVLDASGAVICGGHGGIIRVDPDTREATPLLSEIGGAPIVAVNDMEADAQGGIFAGTADFAALFDRGQVPTNGVFFHLSSRGELRVLREGLVVSNGLGFSPDGRRLYHSETTRGIWVYELGKDGLPGAQELFAPLEDSDGLVVDRDGGVWVACWESAKLLRFRSDGALDRTVQLPFAHIVSLAFGGSDLRYLHVSTGTDAANPGKGGVVRIRVAVPGMRAFRSRLDLPRSSVPG